MKRSTTRRASAGLTALAALSLLAGCAIPVPSPEAQPEAPETMPVLDEPRIDRILADLDEVVAAADEEQDTDLLSPRVANPALRIRGAEYRLAEATADGDSAYSPRTLITSPQAEVVSVSQDWPRTMLVVTEIPDGANVPLLLTLEQEDPRSPYKLHHWVRLLPGTEMPPTAVPATGTEQIPDDASGFLVAPGEAITEYADVLTNGEDSDFADSFALEDDEFYTLFRDEAENLDVVDEAGTFAHRTHPSDSPVIALATEDGGYIVVGEMRTRQKFTKTVSQSEITVPSPHIDALDDEDGTLVYLEDSLIASFRTMVAMYVPGEDAEDGQVTVLGAERVLTGVSRECPRDPDRCA
ncbi:hypothetical protein [Ruania albidiflava]|uniref:hypothetical protein n=1 Tax=Ruania albidiflava TaxID=366586 RepID=UPI0003B3390A|nr:hypothetical protein [Ruania albidiflava]